MDSWLLQAKEAEEEESGITANSYKISFCSNKNVL